MSLLCHQRDQQVSCRLSCLIIDSRRWKYFQWIFRDWYSSWWELITIPSQPIDQDRCHCTAMSPIRNLPLSPFHRASPLRWTKWDGWCYSQGSFWSRMAVLEMLYLLPLSPYSCIGHIDSSFSFCDIFKQVTIFVWITVHSLLPHHHFDKVINTKALKAEIFLRAFCLFFQRSFKGPH